MSVAHAPALAGPSNAGIAAPPAPFYGGVPPINQFSNGGSHEAICRLQHENWIDIIERLGCNQALNQLKEGSHNMFQLFNQAAHVHGNKGGVVNIVVPEVRQVENCRIEIDLDRTTRPLPRDDYFAVSETDIDLAVRFLSNTCNSQYLFPRGDLFGLPAKGLNFSQSGSEALLGGPGLTSATHKLKLSIDRLPDDHAATDRLSDWTSNANGPFTFATEDRASPRSLTNIAYTPTSVCGSAYRGSISEYTAFSASEPAQDCLELINRLWYDKWDTFTFARYNFQSPVPGPERAWKGNGPPDYNNGRLHYGMPLRMTYGHCHVKITSDILETTKYRAFVGVGAWKQVREAIKAIDMQCTPPEMSQDVNLLGSISLPYEFLDDTTGPTYDRTAQIPNYFVDVSYLRQRIPENRDYPEMRPLFKCEASWAAFGDIQSKANCIQAWRNLLLKPIETFHDGEGLESTVSDCTLVARGSDDLKLFYDRIGIILDQCTISYHMGGRSQISDAIEFAVHSGVYDEDEQPELSTFDFNTLKDRNKRPRPV